MTTSNDAQGVVINITLARLIVDWLLNEADRRHVTTHDVARGIIAEAWAHGMAAEQWRRHGAATLEPARQRSRRTDTRQPAPVIGHYCPRCGAFWPTTRLTLAERRWLNGDRMITGGAYDTMTADGDRIAAVSDARRGGMVVLECSICGAQHSGPAQA